MNAGGDGGVMAASEFPSISDCGVSHLSLAVYPGGCWRQLADPGPHHHPHHRLLSHGAEMASPTMDTFCCVVDSSGVGIDTKLDFRVDWYTVVCIISSVCSIVGAVYQLLPRPEPSGRLKRLQFSGSRQRRIIAWLAFADLQAAIGILVRSSYWLYKMSDDEENNNGGVFCALVSGWIQYFYTATYFWNLCYAIDIYLVLRRKQWNSVIYHVLCWGAPAITSAIGLSILYKPNLRCRHDVSHVLPNYLCNQIPLLITMIGNPILYVVSSRKVSEVITSGSAKYSHQERQLASALNQKFFDIVLVFYVCWLPNVVNSLLLWTMWYNLTDIRNTIVTVWYIMAVLNPLQAVLNSLVYRSWEGIGGVRMLLKNVFRTIVGYESPRKEMDVVGSTSSESERLLPAPCIDERRPFAVNGQRSYGSTSSDDR